MRDLLDVGGFNSYTYDSYAKKTFTTLPHYKIGFYNEDFKVLYVTAPHSATAASVKLFTDLTSADTEAF